MRKLFIALLLLPAIAWGAAGFPGATYQKTVTFTTAKILEDGVFAAFCDLSELSTTWWSNCSLSTNIAVTNTSNDTSSYLKYVESFDKSTRTGILWFKLPATTASGGYAVIQTGKTVSVANNKKVFTDCGIIFRFGMGEASGTLADACGNYNATATSAATYGATGIIGKGLSSATGNAIYTVGDVTQLNSASAYTMSFWIARAAGTETRNLYGKGPALEYGFRGLDYGSDFYFEVSSVARAYNVYAQANQYNGTTMCNIVNVFNGAAAGTAKLATYRDGAAKTYSSSSGTIATTTYNLAGNNLQILNDPYNGGAGAGLRGTTDEWRLYSGALSANQVATNYNLQAHSQVAVYSITDSGLVNNGPTITVQPISDTLCIGETATFGVSATGTGTISYQWSRYTGGSWSNVATANAYGYVTAASNNGDSIKVVLTDNNGSTTSNTVLTVLKKPGAWVYASSPAICSTGTSYTFTPTGGACAFDSATIDGVLPVGMDFNRSTGVISGVPR